MNTELFDKALKQKLGEIEPPYNADSWKYVQASIRPKRKYKWVIGWLFASLFIGTTGYLWNENRVLNRIYVESTVIEQKGSEGKSNEYISSNPNPINEIPVADQSMQHELNQLRQEKADALAMVNAVKNENRKLKRAMSEQKAISNRTIVSSNEQHSTAVDGIPVLQLTKEEQKVKNQIETKTLVVVGQNGSPNAVTNINQIEKIAATSTRNGDTVQIARLVTKDSLNTAKNKDLTVNEIPMKLPKQNLETSKFYEIFIGASSFIKNNALAFGGLAEIRFFKRLSLAFGFESNSTEGGKYKDERDFKEATNENFRDKFKHGIPPQTRIEDIHLTRTITQIPIQLNYQFKIVNNFALAPGIGTRLNINQKQYFDYNYTIVGSNPEISQYEQNEKIPVFDNLIFSLGIQYEWKRFLFRVEPFYQWKNNSRPLPGGPPKDKMGVQGKILFRIF